LHLGQPHTLVSWTGLPSCKPLSWVVAFVLFLFVFALVDADEAWAEGQLPSTVQHCTGKGMVESTTGANGQVVEPLPPESSPSMNAAPLEAPPVTNGSSPPSDLTPPAAEPPSIADTDGHVPIYSVCFGGLPSEPYVPGAAYIPQYNGSTVEGIILFDVCAAQELGLGPTDIQRALEHEAGHARGLLHSDDPQDIMYPVLPITGT
jgi:Matrixin